MDMVSPSSLSGQTGGEIGVGSAGQVCGEEAEDRRSAADAVRRARDGQSCAVDGVWWAEEVCGDEARDRRSDADAGEKASAGQADAMEEW